MFKNWYVWALLFMGVPLAGGAISKDEYLKEVAKGNKALAAARGTDAALKIASLEPQAMLSPNFATSLQYYDDQAEPALPFSPQRTTSTQFDASLTKQFALTGSRVSLAFKEGNSAIQLAPGLFGPGSDAYYSFSNTLSVSLSQPLLRDFGARSYRVTQRKVDANIGVARLLNRQMAAATLFEAESVYLTLASLQAIIRLLEDSQERNRKILDWTKNKYADNLVDRVDVLQVEAALRMVENGLAQTRTEAGRAAQKFNSLRGLEPGAPAGELELPEISSTLPNASGEKLEVEAQKIAVIGSEAAVDEVVERFTPDLSLFGTVASAGADRGGVAGAAPDGSKAWSLDHPTYIAGIRFTTSLDFPLYNKVVEGAHLSVEKGKDELESRRLNARQDWASLKLQWDDLQTQMKLVQDLEAVQKEKAEREKRRYQDGGTTNFQVLRFEEDYNQARIQSLRLRAQAALLKAQADFYNGGGIQW